MVSSFQYLEELNEPQREAVLHIDGPLLVTAGAGSGKTRILIYRLAHLIGKGVDPRNILAVTFTNKAADEMKARVSKMLGKTAQNVWVATFHSTAAQILRSHIHLLGYSRGFSIYDQDDSLSAIKAVMKELDIDAKMFSPKWVRAKIEAAKRDRVYPIKPGHDYGEGSADQIGRIAAAYQEKLKAANALDFNDLLLFNLRLFENHPDVLNYYQERFRYIMVDEYQDTNHVQYLIVKNLASRFGNICVVGDEDQSIYGWRGANIENILNFANDFPGAKLIKLEQNYRSTKNIIQAASGLISCNLRRTVKELWTEAEAGQKIRLHQALDDKAEAGYVVEQVLRLRHKGKKLQDMAVFYRTHAQSRQFEDQLRSLDIPYQVYGGIRFYDRKEIKDIIAYLRVLVNPSDEVSLLRIINEPPRGIGPGTVSRLNAVAASENTTLFHAIPMALKNKELPQRARESVSGFLKIMRALQRKIEKGESVSKIVEAVIEKSGYEDSLVEEGTIEAQTRLENLDELLNAVSEYEKSTQSPSLEGLLEKVSLYSDIDDLGSEEGSLIMMTLHSAKGLEFPVVFMVGMEEGLFPHMRALEDEDDERGDALEEERRLCYVGMTRAMELLYLTYARTRSVRGTRMGNEPSRFLSEIPENYLDGMTGGISRIDLERNFRGKEIFKDFGEESIHYDEGEFPVSEGPEYWDADAEVTFRKGMRVKHAEFGVGVIQKLEGHGERVKMTIRFKNGTKKIFPAFARLEPA